MVQSDPNLWNSFDAYQLGNTNQQACRSFDFAPILEFLLLTGQQFNFSILCVVYAIGSKLMELI